jgi:hypothetical protein
MQIKPSFDLNVASGSMTAGLTKLAGRQSALSLALATFSS